MRIPLAAPLIGYHQISPSVRRYFRARREVPFFRRQGWPKFSMTAAQFTCVRKSSSSASKLPAFCSRFRGGDRQSDQPLTCLQFDPCKAQPPRSRQSKGVALPAAAARNSRRMAKQHRSSYIGTPSGVKDPPKKNRNQRLVRDLQTCKSSDLSPDGSDLCDRCSSHRPMTTVRLPMATVHRLGPKPMPMVRFLLRGR